MRGSNRLVDKVLIHCGVFVNSNSRGHESNYPCTQQFALAQTLLLLCVVRFAMKRSRSGLRHAGERGGKALDGVIVCCTGVTSTLKVCADDISWDRFQVFPAES